MFGPVRGPWTEPLWNGWWGDEPPFHVPVFVLTHHEREPLTLGETTFHFVTEGVERAVELAREAAGDEDVSVGGGGETIQQLIRAGLLDELLINQVPSSPVSITSATTPTRPNSPSRRGIRKTRSSSPTSICNVAVTVGKTIASSSGISR